MKLKVLLLLTITCFGHLFAASAVTDRPADASAGAGAVSALVVATITPLSPYLEKVQRLSYEIKTAEDETSTMALTADLGTLLEAADETSSSHSTYQQAAYALFLNGASPAESTSALLREAQALATPVRLNEGMSYIAFPTNDAFVVLERLTDENWDVWHEYAPRNATEWGKYLPQKTGLLFFSQRVGKLPQHGEYDMWIAYISHTAPAVIAEKRKPKADIDPNDIDMVMSVQMKEDVEIYSPMGISRTIEAAKKLYEDEKAGKPRQRLYPSESVWLHVLTARIVRDIYPTVTSFWTFPVPAMAAILANALYPQLRIIAPTEVDRMKAEYTGNPLIKPEEMLLSDFLEGSHSKVQVVYEPKAPWAEEHEFSAYGTIDKESKPIEIAIANLLRTVF